MHTDEVAFAATAGPAQYGKENIAEGRQRKSQEQSVHWKLTLGKADDLRPGRERVAVFMS